MGPQGAVWFETLSEDTGTVDKPTWDAMRIGMACTTTDTLAEIKAELEKLCSTTSCDYEKVQNAIAQIQDRMDHMQKQLQYFSTTLRAQ
jgi:uncharacterized protein YpuA (DUF1002 family)